MESAGGALEYESHDALEYESHGGWPTHYGNESILYRENLWSLGARLLPIHLSCPCCLKSPFKRLGLAGLLCSPTFCERCPELLGSKNGNDKGALSEMLSLGRRSLEVLSCFGNDSFLQKAFLLHLHGHVSITHQQPPS